MVASVVLFTSPHLLSPKLNFLNQIFKWAHSALVSCAQLKCEITLNSLLCVLFISILTVISISILLRYEDWREFSCSVLVLSHIHPHNTPSSHRSLHQARQCGPFSGSSVTSEGFPQHTYLETNALPAVSPWHDGSCWFNTMTCSSNGAWPSQCSYLFFSVEHTSEYQRFENNSVKKTLP